MLRLVLFMLVSAMMGTDRIKTPFDRATAWRLSVPRSWRRVAFAAGEGLMRMRGVLMALALVALPLSAPASAQDKPAAPGGTPSSGNGDAAQVPGQIPRTLVVEPVAMMIAAFDANGDGKVTRDEVTKGVEHSFYAIDTAHTGTMGYIAFADWAKLWMGDPNALPSPFEVDTNGDNQITLAELQAQFASIFVRLDKDKDGVLTRAELLTIRANSGMQFGDGKRGRKGGRR